MGALGVMRVALGLLVRPPLAGWVVPWREVHGAPVESRAELRESLRRTGQTVVSRQPYSCWSPPWRSQPYPGGAARRCRGRAAEKSSTAPARASTAAAPVVSGAPRPRRPDPGRRAGAESALATVKGTVSATATLAALPSTVAQIAAPALFSPCPAAPRVLPPAPPSLPALLLVEVEVAGPGRWGALPSRRGNRRSLRFRSMRTAHDLKGVRGRSVRISGATELRSCGVTASRSAVCGPPSSSRRRTPQPRRTVRRVRRPAR
ncbi:hypothetical protein QFZ76_004568 [Streptomyces sp. V4I2]|nr:hypothetical protein [Streptomyces sp. V4I2]